MQRLLLALLLLAFAAPLSGCGIKGNLKTPPPVWGEAKTMDTDAETVADADATEDPFADPLDDDEDDVGYGIDVTNTP